MISLMLSSSSSGSIGRRNGRINSKLIAKTSQCGSPAISRASKSENSGLRDRRFYGTVIVLMVFRAGLFGAVQLQDRSDPNFPDAVFRVRLLVGVFPAAQLAFHLDMRALGERLGELRELAEDDATVPFGVRNVLAILLIGGLGCQRESGQAAIVIRVGFCITADKADQGYFVLVHNRVSCC